MKPYDYLIVGAGLFGAVFAHEACLRGKKCLVAEKRAHVAGNIFTERMDGIDIHRYGAHIFHTSDCACWDYISRFVTMNGFINSPIANYQGELYNLPFNMNTFSRMWGITSPAEAQAIIARQSSEITAEPANLEEQAIRLVGRDLYEKLVRGYTEKQWGRPCCELPPFIIRRLPVRFTFDNNYFADRWQGVPEEGYTALVERLLEGCDVRCGVDYLAERAALGALAERTVYTGTIDSYFDSCFGSLEYRSLRFETRRLTEENHQGVAVVNYTDRETPYTRSIEHRHFAPRGGQEARPVTYVTLEYPREWRPGAEPYYPINDEKNTKAYAKYRALADEEKNVLFGGRLAEYRYYDMDKTILSALEAVRREFGEA